MIGDNMRHNTYNLERFVTAQRNTYDYALDEIREGEKHSHWMWFIFPQLDALGMSSTAKYYGIRSLDEAIAYMQHPLLRKHLLEISEELLNHTDRTAYEIFGFPDEIKLKSSMTLFAQTKESPVFQKVLDKFFRGEADAVTIKLLNA